MTVYQAPYTCPCCGATLQIAIVPHLLRFITDFQEKYQPPPPPPQPLEDIKPKKRKRDGRKSKKKRRRS